MDTLSSKDVWLVEGRASLIVVETMVSFMAARLPPADRTLLCEHLLSCSAVLERQAAEGGTDHDLARRTEAAIRRMVGFVMSYPHRPGERDPTAS